jgi:hypothetical protein
VAFIETKNLDGETNLKPKNVEKSLLEYFPDESDVPFILFSLKFLALE